MFVPRTEVYENRRMDNGSFQLFTTQKNYLVNCGMSIDDKINSSTIENFVPSGTKRIICISS
jgi:hypothetical protein